jgi:hypothetical protein
MRMRSEPMARTSPPRRRRVGSRSPATSSKTRDSSGSLAPTMETTRTSSQGRVPTFSGGADVGKGRPSGPVIESNGLRARMGAASRGGTIAGETGASKLRMWGTVSSPPTRATTPRAWSHAHSARLAETSGTRDRCILRKPGAKRMPPCESRACGRSDAAGRHVVTAMLVGRTAVANASPRTTSGATRTAVFARESFRTRPRARTSRTAHRLGGGRTGCRGRRGRRGYTPRRRRYCSHPPTRRSSSPNTRRTH